MSIVVSMKIQRNWKMGVSCRSNAFERNATAAIRLPYCLNCVKWFLFMYLFLWYVFQLLRYQQQQKAIVVVVVGGGGGGGGGAFWSVCCMLRVLHVACMLPLVAVLLLVTCRLRVES
jgi:hypothetical protein